MTWSILTILGGRIIRSLILGVERSQKLFRRRAQRQKLDVRGLRLGLQRGCIKGKSRARRNTRDVGGLGLGVEGNAKGGLFSTNEMLGKCWRLWAKSPKGMIKTGDLENRGKIGVRQKGVLRTQWGCTTYSMGGSEETICQRTWLE